jgi:hypothetical protein
MYAALFDEDAEYQFHVTHIEEEDDTGGSLTCRVGDVRRSPAGVGARLVCSSSPPIPADLSPEGYYVATPAGLYRTGGPVDDAGIAALRPDGMVMLPEGTARAIREGERHGLEIHRGERGSWCALDWVGAGDPLLDEGRSVTLCFRRGAGLVGGAFTRKRGDELLRGAYTLAAVKVGRGADADLGPVRVLTINEIAAAGEPTDWIEVVNVSTKPVQLEDFVLTDRRGDLTRAVAFPRQVLAPGARVVQPLTREDTGFQLNGAEDLLIYRRADHAFVDEVTWDEGASPQGGSFARVPDTTGGFVTVSPATPGEPNRP